MKTLEEFVKEIGASAELQKTLTEIRDKASLEAFLKEHGCDATAEEFATFVKSSVEGEISDEAAEEAAGGFQFQPLRIPTLEIFKPVVKTDNENFDW